MLGGARPLVGTGATDAPLATGGGHVVERIREREPTTAAIGDDLVRGHGGGLVRGLCARRHRVRHCPTRWGIVPVLHRPHPGSSETRNTDHKGQPMSKAGSSLLPTTLVRAADTAGK